MKKFNVFFTLLLVVFSSFLMTANASNIEPATIKTQLSELLKEADFDTNDQLEDSSFMIEFMINENNEIIVLSTNESQYDSLIKNTLNYKKIETLDVKYGTKYQIKVIVEK